MVSVSMFDDGPVEIGYIRKRTPNILLPSHLMPLRALLDGKALFAPSVDTAALRREVQRGMWAFLLTDEGLRLRVGTVKSRPTRTRPDPPLSFGCFYCDAALDDYLLFRNEERARAVGEWSAVYDTTVCLPKELMLQRPHWCFPASDWFCSE